MSEYIERETLYEQMNATGAEFSLCDALEMIEKFPAADVAPVVHGRWDDSGRYTFPGGSVAVRCTMCGCALTVSEYHLQNWYYCPVCGAKMDGGSADG